MLKYSEFRMKLLAGLAIASRNVDGYVVAESIAEQLFVNGFKKDWVREAVREFEGQGLARIVMSHSGSGIQLTGRGTEEAEKICEELGWNDEESLSGASGEEKKMNIVFVDQESPEYTEANFCLSETIEAIKAANDVGEMSTADRDRIILEIEAGRLLLTGDHVDMEKIEVLLLAVLRYLKDKFTDAAFGAIAAKALGALAALLGFAL